jgi:hypothetical protein
MSKFDLRTTTRMIAAGLVLAAAPVLSAHAGDRCDSPQPGPDARACAAAAQGPTELRRLIERTRAVYGLYYWDYARPEKTSIAVVPGSNPSEVARSVAQREQGTRSQ